jgi:hypothetical protein
VGAVRTVAGETANSGVSRRRGQVSAVADHDQQHPFRQNCHILGYAITGGARKATSPSRPLAASRSKATVDQVEQGSGLPGLALYARHRTPLSRRAAWPVPAAPCRRAPVPGNACPTSTEKNPCKTVEHSWRPSQAPVRL